jgi:hypothetical protein
MSRILALMLAACACCLDARALELYAGEALVDGKTAAERREAIPAALINVLQKQSGQRELPAVPELDRALRQAEGMVLAFHYVERQRPLPDGSLLDETWLVARFSPDAVDRVVRELGLPRWRHERLPLIFWVVVDDGQGRRMMPVEYGYAWDGLTWIAAHRGLPIRWAEFGPDPVPPADLQLLWGGFTEHLQPASPGLGGVVVIAARRTGPDWQLRWSHDNGIETVGWRSQDRDLAFALANGLHRLIDLVAARDSIRGSGVEGVQARLLIGGLHGPEDYARCLAYLEKLSMVDAVVVESAQAGQVGFRLDLNAEPQFLVEVLRRDGFLTPGSESGEYRLSDYPKAEESDR